MAVNQWVELVLLAFPVHGAKEGPYLKNKQKHKQKNNNQKTKTSCCPEIYKTSLSLHSHLMYGVHLSIHRGIMLPSLVIVKIK